MPAPAAVYIGTSGWYYPHWTGVLYPPKLPKGRWFEVYAQRFNTVEINATYYRLPSVRMVEGWYRKAPEGFVYVVKASQNITHRRRLRNCGPALRVFLERIAPLRDKLANILFQLPPSLRQDLALLEDFLGLLAEEDLEGIPPAFRPRRRGKRREKLRLPVSFEFRHPSWECEETFEVLRRWGATHVVVSRVDYPFVDVHTAPLAYYRCHGPGQMYSSSYPDRWLARLARRLFELSRQGTISFTFFNNDVAGHAVRNAETLKRCLKRLTDRAEEG